MKEGRITLWKWMREVDGTGAGLCPVAVLAVLNIGVLLLELNIESNCS
jgi:uncharacterized spore protein YtfJ